MSLMLQDQNPILSPQESFLAELQSFLRHRDELIIAAIHTQEPTNVTPATDNDDTIPPYVISVNDKETGKKICAAKHCRQPLNPPTTFCPNCLCEVHRACKTLQCQECEGSLFERWFDFLFGSFNLAILLLSICSMIYLVPFQIIQRLLFPRMSFLMSGIRNLCFFYHYSFIFGVRVYKIFVPCALYLLGAFSVVKEDDLEKYNEFVVLLKDSFPALDDLYSSIVRRILLAIPLHILVLFHDEEMLSFFRHVFFLNPLIMDFPFAAYVANVFILIARILSYPDIPIILSIILSAIFTVIYVQLLSSISDATFDNELNMFKLLVSTHLSCVKWSNWKEKKLSQKQLWLIFAYSIFVYFLFANIWMLDVSLLNAFDFLF